MACIDKSTVDLNKGRSGFLNFLDVPASKKSIFVFIAVNEYPSSLERYLRVFGKFLLLIIGQCSGPLLPISWKNLQFLRHHI